MSSIETTDRIELELELQPTRSIQPRPLSLEG